MEFCVTTCGRPTSQISQLAEEVASNLSVPCRPRNKKSVHHLQKMFNEDVLVIGKDRFEFFQKGLQDPIFFHPNSAMYRVKRIMKDESDPFLESTQLKKGESLLDCTLGLASDSIVAAFQVGDEGSVVGLEAHPILALLVKRGLEDWCTSVHELNRAFLNIDVIHAQSLNFLQKTPDQSFDCVYFDPMFDHPIEEAHALRTWSRLAHQAPLDEKTLKEAKRVAKRRVVLKAHFKSPLFEKYGFIVKKRKTTAFHFGHIDTSTIL